MKNNFKVNKDLIWDYDFSKEDLQTESFKKWYIARALVRGNFEDIKNIGLENIYRYLTEITIPYQVKKFWEWFLDLPSNRKNYEHIDRKPDPHSSPGIPSPFIKG